MDSHKNISLLLFKIEEELTCPIQFDLLKETVNLSPCNHKFSKEAVEKYKVGDNCPVCKIVIQSKTADHIVKNVVGFFLELKQKIEESATKQQTREKEVHANLIIPSHKNHSLNKKTFAFSPFGYITKTHIRVLKLDPKITYLKNGMTFFGSLPVVCIVVGIVRLIFLEKFTPLPVDQAKFFKVKHVIRAISEILNLSLILMIIDVALTLFELHYLSQKWICLN